MNNLLIRTQRDHLYVSDFSFINGTVSCIGLPEAGLVFSKKLAYDFLKTFPGHEAVAKVDRPTFEPVNVVGIVDHQRKTKEQKVAEMMVEDFDKQGMLGLEIPPDMFQEFKKDKLKEHLEKLGMTVTPQSKGWIVTRKQDSEGPSLPK